MDIKTKLQRVSEILSNKNFLESALKTIIAFSGGIISAIPYFLGSYSPFAAALPAALNGINSIVCAAGAIFGIFVFQSGISAFRYFATVITSTAILHIFTYYFGIKRERLLRPLCPGFCCLIVNSVFLFSQKPSMDLVISTLAETVLTPLCVPVFVSAVKCLNFKKTPIDSLDEKQLTCVIIFLTFMAGQLRGAGVAGDFSAMFIFFSEILFFYLRKSFFAASVSSAFCAVSYAMSGNADFMCGALAVCGGLCSLIEPKRKYIAAIISVATCFVGCAFGEYTQYFPALAASALAAVIFSFIPTELIQKGKENKPDVTPNAVAIPLQAKEISRAVENLGDCINAVRKTLRPITVPPLEDVIFRATQKVCSRCELQESCINQLRQKDNPHYERIAKDVTQGNLDFSSFPEDFSETCYCCNEIIHSIKQAYFAHCTQINSDNKISKFQELTGNQFKSFGSIIGNICSTAVNGGAVTLKTSTVCAACAEDFGIEIKNAHLCTNKAGHEYFNLAFSKPKDNFNVTQLTKNLCRDTGFELDFPTLIQKDDLYTLVFKQKAKVDFKIAAAVKPATPQGVSGDYYRSFKDSFSRQVVLLSDGMGTGSRAAIDSAFTCETFCNLLKSGLDVKTTAATVNCAMLMKSTDESLATVDLIIADPILSSVKIYKCGAAPTFILRSGKPFVLEAESAPIGILDKVDLASSEFSVTKGDIILTVSDGITGDNWGWISAELKSRSTDSPTALAKHILQCACDRKLGKRADDMTVIAIIVE